jgi:hypothetical protein
MRRSPFRLPLRIGLPWLVWLALLLPLAQSAAAWHAISHVAPAAAHDDGGPAHAPCDLCLTAAAASGPGLPGSAPSFAAPAHLADALPEHAAPVVPHGGRAAYRSRAPPPSSH